MKINKPKSWTDISKMRSKLLWKHSWLSTNQYYLFFFLLQGHLQMFGYSRCVDISEHLTEGKSTAPLPEPSRALSSWIQTYSREVQNNTSYTKVYEQTPKNQWCLKVIIVSSSLLNQVLSQGFVYSNIHTTSTSTVSQKIGKYFQQRQW